jgi:hypothetical protein
MSFLRARRRDLLVWAVIVVAVAVHLPALTAPFMLDDHAQIAMAEGRFGAPRGPFDLYDYVDDANRTSLFDRGVIPWWTDPRLVVCFLRPLPSALVWADHLLFGAHAVWPHVHSLLWWALGTLGVAVLLRRSFGLRAGLLGTLVFALAPCHAIPLVWVANREALVSTALGVWALVSYERWREEHRPRDGAASLLLFALATLAGEYTLGFVGYAVAIELTVRRQPLARRALGVLAFVVPVATYLAVHVALGYDARGTGFYRNPLHDIGTYASGAPRRLAILVGSAWLGADDTWTMAPRWELACLGLLSLATLTYLLVLVVRRLPDAQRRRAGWMLVGSILAIAPVLSVEASARLLGVSMIGVSGVVGVALDRAWFPEVAPPRRGVAELAGLVAIFLAFAHFIRAPLDTLATMRVATAPARAYVSRVAWLRQHLDPSRSTVMVLRGNSSETVLWGPLLLGDRAPARWRVLSFASGRSLLLRTGPRTMDLVQSERPLFNVGPDDLFRGTGSLGPGASVELAGMKATVVQVDDQSLPKRLTFELDRDLDDPSVQWISEDLEGFREETIPPVGYGAPVLP